MKARIRHIARYRLLTWLWATFALCLVASCSDDDGHAIRKAPPRLAIVGNTLPYSAHHLNVLAIGNSYTNDGTAYLQEVLDGMNIDRADYSVYTVTIGSTSLKFWADQLVKPDTLTAICMAGNSAPLRPEETRAPFGELIAHPWDVIVLQQFSSEATDYGTFNPPLRQLLSYIQYNCSNPHVAVAWQLIPPYSTQSDHNNGLSGDRRWTQLVIATETMMHADGIHIVIPTGTTLQLARRSRLETPYDLTRDHTHLCYGVGRYLAACTWAETLFSPVFDTSVANCSADHILTDAERSDNYEGFLPGSSVTVDATNRSECLRLVLQACAHPFALE